jgi:predicted dehydrogenase
MKKPIRVALAAYGMSGRLFHAPFIHSNPDFELAAVLERTTDFACADYPYIKTLRTYDAILQDSTIDLVVVNTPNPLHYSMAKAALLAGKHVVVEKPLTPTLAEGEELIALADSQGLLLSVYHNRCFASGYCTAQQILTQKLLGELRSCTINLERYRPQPGPKKWKEEQNPAAGLLYDIGVHLLDEALMLFGEPLSVAADLRAQRSSGKVNDFFAIRLEYGDFYVSLNGSLLAREPAPAYVLHGEQGSYVKVSQDLQELRLLQGVAPELPGWADETEAQWGILHNDSGRVKFPTVAGDYQDYYRNIYAALCDKKHLLTGPQRALRILNLVELAIESDRQGRRLPVHILAATGA